MSSGSFIDDKTFGYGEAAERARRYAYALRPSERDAIRAKAFYDASVGAAAGPREDSTGGSLGRQLGGLVIQGLSSLIPGAKGSGFRAPDFTRAFSSPSASLDGAFQIGLGSNSFLR